MTNDNFGLLTFHLNHQFNCARIKNFKITLTGTPPRIMLSNIRKQVDKSLEQFLDKIKTEYHLDLVDPILYRSIREFTLRKGKRIRPMLLAISYKGYSKNTKRISPSIYYAATCIELLHNFMLIHDDIIDRSDLRRGKPTLHKLLSKAVKTREKDKLGYDLSIIAGDIVYALAIGAFLSINEKLERKERALKYFIQTAVLTAMGEFIDTLYGVKKVNNVSEDDIFLNYTLKTARYTFDCPMVVGAILAGAGKKDIRLLSELGLAVGQAFQIQDDIIGVFDSQKNIGKSILSDIAESKKTILVCHANKNLSRSGHKNFMERFNKKKKTYQDLVAIRRIFLEAGSLDYSIRAIQQRLQRGRVIMGKLKMKPKHLNLIGTSFDQLFDHTRKIARQYNISAEI